MPDFHWTCTELEGNIPCGFALNASWQNYCMSCGKEYSQPHGALIVTFATTIERYVRFDNGAGLIPKDEQVQGRVVLPEGLFAEFAPQPWYDTFKSQQYFKALAETLVYSSDRAYRLGVNTGWYRTTRILYPDYSTKTKVERQYTSWRLGAGRNLKGSFGLGLLDGTKAAVEAFCSR